MCGDHIAEIDALVKRMRPCSKEACCAYFCGDILQLNFHTEGCRYGSCVVCDYGWGKNCISLEEIDRAFDRYYEPVRNKARVLLIGTLGSILDPVEFAPDLLQRVLVHAADSDVDTVILETHGLTIDSDVVADVVSRLAGKHVMFEIGLESSNESVRYVSYGKQLSQNAVETCIKTIHKTGAECIVNLMVGAPFLSKAERIADAVRSVFWAFEAGGADEVALFPVNVRPYTALRRLRDAGLYDPPSLSELVVVLASLPPELLDRVSLAWWGNRRNGYSLPDLVPDDDGFKRGALPLLYERFMSEREAVVRADLVEKMAGQILQKYKKGCVSIPDLEELTLRRSIAAETLKKHPFGDKLVWIGPRESDIDTVEDLFFASSTVYGTGKKSNSSYSREAGMRTNHNDVTFEQISFMSDEQERIVSVEPRARFLTYNPYYAYGGSTTVLERQVCLNGRELLEKFCDKLSFRQFAKQYVSVPESEEISGRNLASGRLSELINAWGAIVVQRGISSGGHGTFVVRESADFPEELCEEDEMLLASKLYEPNVSVNAHAVIYSDASIVFSPSVQVIVTEEGKMLYGGCDYVSYNELSNDVRDGFENGALRLCEAIREEGYRGVVGFDAVIAGQSVLFLEANARFQASTHAYNLALSEVGLPSFHQMHMEAFCRPVPGIASKKAAEFRPSVSMLAYSSRGDQGLDRQVDHVRRVAGDVPGCVVFENGLIPDEPRAKGAYLFGVAFPGAISSVVEDPMLNVDQNALPSSWEFGDFSASERDLMRLKIALLNQGATISKAAQAAISARGDLREGVNDSIDIRIFGLVVNVALAARWQSLSPFAIDACEEGLRLLWLGREIAPIECYWRTGLEDRFLGGGVPVGRVCLLAADRVRVQHYGCCDFARMGLACRFCNFPGGRPAFGVEDAIEAVDLYLNSGIDFRHFLIGGGTDASSRAIEGVARLAAHIRSRCDKPIYYMDVPPLNVGDLEVLKRVGVDEVGFNIEVWDRSIARDLMPAKGRIPLERYLSALERSVKIWGRNGAVRSALLVGLEPMESALAGVEELAKRGVSPILSVFRPLEGTPMARVSSPSNEWIERFYDGARSICASCGVELGPSCKECRNNVLAL